VKVGVWLKREYLQGGVIDTQFRCSICNYENGLVMNTWSYCPCCGSRVAFTIDEAKRLFDKYEKGDLLCD